MQASPAWTPPSGTLGGIVAEARERAHALDVRRTELEHAVVEVSGVPSLESALRRPDVAIIAELKRRSPSKGWIHPTLAAGEQAQRYLAGGAAAVSVLTEPRHFAGSIEDLLEVRRCVGIPTLKKDFHVAPVQLLEAKVLGASAALLIARALEPGALREMIRVAAELALEVLVEVRDERELDVALSAGTTLLGVNNRDLETLAIDPATSERLLSRVPSNVVAVAESGVATRADVERAARAGADAVLVGSSISASEDPAAAVHALAGVARAARGR